MHSFNRGKKWTKTVGYFCNFQKTAQRKQSPIGRKFCAGPSPYLHIIVCWQTIDCYISSIHVVIAFGIGKAKKLIMNQEIYDFLVIRSFVDSQIVDTKM
jgi:hypothetical protein